MAVGLGVAAAGFAGKCDRCTDRFCNTLCSVWNCI